MKITSSVVHLSGTNGRAFCGVKLGENSSVTTKAWETTCSNCLGRVFQCRDYCEELYNFAREAKELLEKSRARSNFSTEKWNTLREPLFKNGRTT